MNLRLIFGLLAAASPAAAMLASEATDTVAPALGEIVVTGSNSRIPRRLLPYTVSVVGSRELESSGNTQVLSILSGRVPSLFVTERSVIGFGVSNGGAGHIKLRGVGGDRASGVLMMVDGQPQFAGIYSHHVADSYQKDYVERIEVLRGPGSVLYGSNAMAGAINVITRGASHPGTTLTLQSQYGSFNTWLSSLSATSRYGRFSSLLSLSYNRTDGTARQFDFRQADGYAKVGYDISSRWKTHADFSLMNFKGSDPIYPTIKEPPSTGVYRQKVTRGEGGITLSNRYATTDGALRLYYNFGHHLIDDPTRFKSLDDRMGLILYQNFAPWRGSSATVGFDFDAYSGKIPMSGGKPHQPGAMTTISRKSIIEYSPYVTLSQRFWQGILNVNAGVRMACSDMFATRWVPQAGFSVNPGRQWTLKANAAMGYRNPSFRELYLYRMANPDLQPERMMNYEVQIGKTFSRYLTADVTAYLCRGTDMIQTVDFLNQNTGRFTNKGIELSASSRPLDNLTLSLTYSYLHTSLSDLTSAPTHQYFIGADWTPLRGLDVSAELRGISGLFVSADIHRQSYALLNLRVSYAICRYVSVFTRLENITDARYVINRGYPMPGFTAMGGFRATIDFPRQTKH